MNRLQREIISRIAMVVLAAMCAVAGFCILHFTIFIMLDRYLFLFGIGLVAVAAFLLAMCFVPSVNTQREPEDERYRIK